MTNTDRQKHLDRIGIIILLIGLISAVLIYVITEDSADSAVGYDLIGGTAYGISPESSKRYIHDLEMYGGKAAVLADEINRWFAGLWHGTNLAFTIGFITIVIAVGFFFVARLSFDDEDPETD